MDITYILRQQFPQWMAIRNNDESIGAQFLKAFGIKLEELMDYIDEFFRSKFIGSINIGEIDIIYKTTTQHSIITDSIDVVADGITLKRVDRLDEFYKTIDDIYIVDTDKDTLYFRKQYNSVYINGIEHALEMHHVWNAFDELGLMVGLYRVPGETNAKFKDRILDVFKNPPSDTIDGLKNHLSRAFGIEKDDIDIMSIEDLQNEYVDIFGNVKPPFLSYIERLNKVVPFTWDTVTWDESYWDTVKDIAFDYLPHIYNPDLSMWKQEEFQSGIGDNDDLEVIPPSIEEDEQTFKYKVGLAATVDKSDTIYTEHKLKYKVYATGQKASVDVNPKNAKYTVVASEDVPFEYDITAHKIYKRTYTDDFNDITYDSDHVDIVPGNTITSPYNRRLKVNIAFKTSNPASTPILNSLTINWYDINNTLQTTTLTTAEDFTRNDAPNSATYPIINTDLNNIDVSVNNGSLSLSQTVYKRPYMTINSWHDGLRENVKSTRAGLIMILPKER